MGDLYFLFPCDPALKRKQIRQMYRERKFDNIPNDGYQFYHSKCKGSHFL